MLNSVLQFCIYSILLLQNIEIIVKFRKKEEKKYIWQQQQWNIFSVYCKDSFFMVLYSHDEKYYDVCNRGNEQKLKKKH